MRRGAAIAFMLCLLSGCTLQAGDEFVLPKYRTWARITKKAVDYPVPGHGASLRIIYANEPAVKARTGRKESDERLPMPDGAIIVKEVYERKGDVDKKEPQLTIMVKKGSAPGAQGGWLYYTKNPGESPVPVRSRLCIGCHEAANEPHPYFDKNKKGLFRDYLFNPILR